MAWQSRRFSRNLGTGSNICADAPGLLAPFAQVFDVEIAPNLTEAYVSDFLGHAIWVIDLTQTPPAAPAAGCRSSPHQRVLVSVRLNRFAAYP